MRTVMSRTTLKEKGQITLPVDIRKQIHANKGDLFDCKVVDGTVVMTLQKVIPASVETDDTKEPRDLSQWFGTAPGVYKSAEEVDHVIRNQRDAWED